jgi:hypothetical protein
MKRVKVDCLQCGKPYFVIHSRIDITKYCSRLCQTKGISLGKSKGLGVSRNKGAKRPDLSVMNKLNPRRGPLSSNWKGGITPINKIIRGSVEYIEWRKSVFERDNYTCVFCGARNGNGRTVVLNADHIKPFATYPELRLELSNGRTLCRPCHKTTFVYMGNQYVDKKCSL